MSDILAQAAALERLLADRPLALRALDLLERVLGCADALTSMGESRRALELLDGVGALTKDGGPGDLSRVATCRMRSLYFADEYSECLALSRSSQATLGNEASGDEVLGWRILEGICLADLHRNQEGLETLLSVRRELLARPDSVLTARCSTNLSVVYLNLGDRNAARDMAMDAIVSAKRIGVEVWAGFALLNLAFVERQQCRWALAEQYSGEAERVFERAGYLSKLNDARRARALAAWKRGRLASACEAASSCVTDAKLRGASHQHALAVLLRSLVLIHLGKLEEAGESLRSEIGPSEALKGTRSALLKDEFAGDVLFESGEVLGAQAAYESLWQRAFALSPRGDIVAELRRRRAECFLLLGKHERARHEAEEAIVHCTEIGDRYEEAATYRVLGLALGALGRHDEARTTFDKGFAAYEDIETPYEWGKLWMSYADWICGEHAGAYRDLNGAHEAYRNAATYFENIGAAGKLEEARKRLAALEDVMQREGAVVDLGVTAKPKPLRRPREIADLRRRGQWIHEQFGMVTRSKIMIDMLEEVARVAASDLPVLILGESGTGKELVAKGVHKLSGRRGRFVPINASALPDTLVEGELFGHTQGAFTNAVRDREGLFEFSNNGTIFLDEIGEMSVDLQAKLLRVLELGEIRRVGGTASVLVDARVVAATNRDRAQMEAGEGFRADLYYRLSHAMFEIPPLRQRGEDVEFLVEHFLDKFCGMYNKRVTISPEAMHRLVSNPWPGNVRQLAATMQRLIVSARTVHTLMPREVPAPSRATVATAPASLEEELLHKERQRIIEALEKSQWVKADAARLLRMSRTTLITKMKRMHIEG